jgi:hypothetical protein
MDAPGGDPRFADDPYVATHHPRSALCLPISWGGQRIVLLYAVNSPTGGAFTQERIEATAARRRAGNAGHFHYDLEMRHKEGSIVWVSVSSIALQDAAGGPLGTLAMMLDQRARPQLRVKRHKGP